MGRLEKLFDRHAGDDEEIIAIIHKHWFVGVNTLCLPISSFVVGWGFLAHAPSLTLFYVIAGWSVFSLIWTARNFFDYYLDAWIITDTGVIDVAWHGWFHRESTRALYSDIEGVSYEVAGVWATMMKYGTINVEKISTGTTLELEYVPYPRKVEEIILKQKESYLHDRNMHDATQVQDVLTKIVTQHIQLEEYEDDEDDEEYEDDDE